MDIVTKIENKFGYAFYMEGYIIESKIFCVKR